MPGTEINSVFIYLHFAAIQFEQLYKGLLVAITKKEEKGRILGAERDSIVKVKRQELLAVYISLMRFLFRSFTHF